MITKRKLKKIIDEAIITLSKTPEPIAESMIFQVFGCGVLAGLELAYVKQTPSREAIDIAYGTALIRLFTRVSSEFNRNSSDELNNKEVSNES